MIISRLMGGLGNQMFQYAAGRALSLRLGSELKLDLSWFEDMEGFVSRKYGLDAFCLLANRAESYDLAHFEKEGKRSCLGRIKLFSGLSKRRVAEPHRHYWPRFEKLQGDILLDGYWQSERYFKNIREILLQDLSLKCELLGKSHEVSNRVASTTAVSLHVRRGDYVNNPEANRVHGTCDLEYYAKAVGYLAAKVISPHFFIFSDDHVWARENIATSYPVTFVTHNDAAKNYEDMRLMSLCKHHIIANSSFGWWGAWLNRDPEKIVVAPQQWFADEERNRETGDLIPEEWVRL